MTPDQIFLAAFRLSMLGLKLIREGRDEATPEEMAAATQRMDDADARLEDVLRRAEGGD